MKLVFSGAQSKMGQQNDRNKSLGGFMSLTPIPNARLNALFSSISMYAQKNQTTETIAIFLYNESPTLTITDLLISNLIYDDGAQAKFRFAAVAPADYQMELIGSSRETPFYATFFEPNSTPASADVVINSGASAGDSINAFGDSITVSVDLNIEGVVDLIVNHFSGSLSYKLKKINTTTFNVIDLSGIENTNAISITILGQINDNVSFSGFDDGAVNLGDISPLGALGLWIQREILPEEVIACELLEDTAVETVETVLLSLSYSEAEI